MHAYNLCTQETEAGVFQVQSQPGLHSENLSQNKQTNNNIYAYIYIYIYIYIYTIFNIYSQAPVAKFCNPSYSGSRDKRISVQSQPQQIVCVPLKKPNTKKGLV
jgi:hypothetical protein